MPFRILVVDDNHLIRRLLGLILEGAVYVALEAESGEAALALAHEALPDLGIVDEAIEIKADVVWMQLGLSHPEAGEEARAAGLQVVMNHCIKIEHSKICRS